MQSVEFSSSFVPNGAPNSTEGQYGTSLCCLLLVRYIERLLIAVTVGPGVKFGDLYQLAHENNRSVAGGWAVNGSVGAGGGWPLGGGHSLLSPYYGLGSLVPPI